MRKYSQGVLDDSRAVLLRAHDSHDMLNMYTLKPCFPSCLLWFRDSRCDVKTSYCAGTCSALTAVAQASDTATAAAGAAAAAVAGGECAASNFVAAAASATAAAAAYVSSERHLRMLTLVWSRKLPDSIPSWGAVMPACYPMCTNASGVMVTVTVMACRLHKRTRAQPSKLPTQPLRASQRSGSYA